MSALPADEIMHQDIVPLCAADIQEQLKKRFAYLSGKFRKPGVRGTARAWRPGQSVAASLPSARRLAMGRRSAPSVLFRCPQGSVPDQVSC